MTLRDQIIQQALTLSPEDREYVVDHLERSLPVTDFLSDDIAQAWSEEIDRRIAAYDRGETEATDFETAKQQMRHTLQAHRNSVSSE
jgi:putative addiction module component (TIGR02574 family)